MTDEVKTNGRHNQQIRGLSVDTSKILPRLTAEQRKGMTSNEKKEYNAKRLKEYRNAYSLEYNYKVVFVNSERYEAKQEQIDAVAFYKKYKDTIGN
jgi:hypothetical protein